MPTTPLGIDGIATMPYNAVTMKEQPNLMPPPQAAPDPDLARALGRAMTIEFSTAIRPRPNEHIERKTRRRAPQAPPEQTELPLDGTQAPLFD